MFAMKPMEQICVFCGSNHGARDSYRRAARELGIHLARGRFTLVYGGGSVGLMGELSNAVIEHGGKVIGIIPRALAEREVANTSVTDLRIVRSMHERKALMNRLSDAFIALPGGMGTLEEFAETLTWLQLGIHIKPCGLLNIDGYFDPLIAFFDHAVQERFLKSEHRALILIDNDAERLIDRLNSYVPPATTERWLEWID